MLPEPPLVGRALALAAELAFAHSSSPEAGRLLHLLAGQRGRERVGEIGTGTGVGTAWLASALAPGVPLYTAEVVQERARAAAALFAADDAVHVLQGRWREVLPEHGPFDLLFYDGGRTQRPDEEGEEVVALLSPGGTVVLDDLHEAHGSDPVRGFWLGHPRLVGMEIGLAPAMRAIVCVRVL
ncbi:MAG: O-methyltransferase [Pseudomonadota bacterium]